MAESNKLIMAIDYNNLSFRNIYTTRHNEQGITSYDTDAECDVFGRNLIKDIIYLSKLFCPSEVYLLSDSRDPWRKDICDGYKSTRKKDETVNMSNIFKAMTDASDFLSDYGFCRISVDNAEADDLAAMLKKCIIPEGSDIIFVSSDADWLQLCEFNKDTSQFVMVYSPIVSGRRGIRPLNMTQECSEWLETQSSMIGNKNYNVKMNVLRAINCEKTMRINPIDPDGILLGKILCGDDGDNVPAFHEFKGKSGKKVRVTQKKMEKVFECCGLPTNVSELTERVEDNSLKQAFKEALKWDVENVDFSERLDRQRRYVELNPNLFPKDIKLGFVEALRGIDRKSIAFKPSAIGNVRDIFCGSKYERQFKTSNGARLNSIFSTLVEQHIPKPEEL